MLFAWQTELRSKMQQVSACNAYTLGVGSDSYKITLSIETNIAGRKA